MPRRTVLLMLDTDPQPSVFDAVVALDAEVDVLLRHGSVTPEQVTGLVHGAMFTRGGEDLKSTAIFIGGSQVAAAERLLEQVRQTFFGSVRVSVLFDPNGANTTAAAAILAARRHVDLKGATAVVLAATGPVGERAARLLAQEGARVRVASRTLAKADGVVENLRRRFPQADLTPVATSSGDETARALEGAQILIAAGAAGVELVAAETLSSAKALRVAIDLNAVPPLGIQGVGVSDKAKPLGDLVAYGALGVGGTKMKIHKAALLQLFERNDRVFDAEELFALGLSL